MYIPNKKKFINVFDGLKLLPNLSNQTELLQVMPLKKNTIIIFSHNLEKIIELNVKNGKYKIFYDFKNQNNNNAFSINDNQIIYTNVVKNNTKTTNNK